MERFKKIQQNLFDNRRRRLRSFFSRNILADQLKILIVDDEKIHQLSLRFYLQRLGWAPETANNGQEAIAMFSNTTYDLVFMDVEMPVMDGLEATRKILSTCTNTPVIIGHTTLKDENIIDKCHLAGMTDVITKPATNQTLTRVMQDFMKTPSNH